MSTKHTPGPWVRCGGATPSYVSINSPKGYIIHGFADHTRDYEQGKPIEAPCWGEQIANARLIAVAPDLLAEAGECLRVFKEIEDSLPFEIWEEAIEPRLYALRAAIAKAKGEA